VTGAFLETNMRKMGLIAFALGSLPAIGAANTLLPKPPGEPGAILSSQGVEVAQQAPTKEGSSQHRRQNPRHKEPAPAMEKRSSPPGADAIQTRLAPGS
jgi:hypothetical protein